MTEYQVLSEALFNISLLLTEALRTTKARQGGNQVMEASQVGERNVKARTVPQPRTGGLGVNTLSTRVGLTSTP